MKKIIGILLYLCLLSACAIGGEVIDSPRTYTFQSESTDTESSELTQRPTQVQEHEPSLTHTKIYITIPTISPSIESISNQVEVYDKKKWKAYTHENTSGGLVKGMIYDIAQAPDGALWFATSCGVSRFDGDNWIAYTSGVGLINGVAGNISVAPDGIVWIGTEEGLSMFNGETWQTYTTLDGLISNHIRAIAIAPDGKVWFGAYENRSYKPRYGIGGISSFDGKIWRSFTTSDGLASNEVWDLLIDANGLIWVGTDKGLSRYDGKAWQTFTADYYWPSHGYFEIPAVTRLAMDTNGSLWFISSGIGLSRFDGDVWENFTYPALLGLPPLSIEVTNDKRVWIGDNEIESSVERALIMFDGKNWTVYESLPFRFVFDILELQDGSLWLGTEKGIYRYMPNQIKN